MSNRQWIVKFRERSMTGNDMPIMYREVEGSRQQCEAGARQTAELNDWCYLGIGPRIAGIPDDAWRC